MRICPATPKLCGTAHLDSLALTVAVVELGRATWTILLQHSWVLRWQVQMREEQFLAVEV